MPKAVIVSATDLVRKFGDYARTALSDPVQIAQHGQVRLALVNADLIENLPKRDDSARLSARFDILFDTISTMVTLVDSGANIIRMNAAARRYFELAQDEVEGRPLQSLLGMPEIRSIPAAVLRAVSSGQEEDFHVESKRYAGRTLHARITPFPGGVAVFADDVTTTMMLARNDATRAALNAALDAAGVGKGSINLRGVIEWASHALEEMTGALSDKLLNVRLSSLFTVRSRDAVISLVEDALSQDKGGALECELLTERGPLAVCLSIAPVVALELSTQATFVVRTV